MAERATIATPHLQVASRIPTELILRALTFVDEYDPPLTLEECIQFRGVVRLVFRTLVESAPYFWSRILITPTTHFIWFALARSYPLSIHVRMPSSCLFLASDHDSFNLWEHLGQLLKLIAASLSTFTDLVIETTHPDILRIATNELHAIDFEVYPQVLTDFVFLNPSSSGQPFHPFSQLSIVRAEISSPVFSRISMDCSM
ncbi:hypothetical protein C8J57DRAFT_1492705 [Mycena rebaudengoi]|nr:hypothetical protein C8J57DRAFT_1492705 [Mycena rebaudengoi]